MSKLINLFIDESGAYFIGEPRYKFFLICGVIMTPDQNELAGLLMAKWRRKYLTSPDKCFHAVDFFEDRIKDYKQHHLTITRSFNRALEELLSLLSYIEFRAEVYYVDLQEMRSFFKIPKPPINPGNSATPAQKSTYRQQKKKYKEEIKKQMGSKRDENYPLKPCLFKAFELHSQELQKIPHSQGYINFESQSTSDGRFVDFYHLYRTSSQHYGYGEEIIGMDLHTKSSLHGGIEIADFIAYVSMQTLRFQNKLKNELLTITRPRQQKLQEIRTHMREKLKIRLVDVTKLNP